jgi:hypothetical protein
MEQPYVRPVMATRKNRQYGSARTKSTPLPYTQTRPYLQQQAIRNAKLQKGSMQAANAAAAALRQVQGIVPQKEKQPGVKQTRRVTEKKLAANQLRRNISKKFKNRGIKQYPERLIQYKIRRKAGQSNNDIFAQMMNPDGAPAPTAPTAPSTPYNSNNNAVSEVSNFGENQNEYQRLLQEARNAPNVIENENDPYREPMSAENAAAAALAAVKPGGPVTVPSLGKTAKVRKINQLRGKVPKTAKAPIGVSRPRGRPRKTPLMAPVVPSEAPSVTPFQATTTSAFGQQTVQPQEQSTGHVEAGKKAATSPKGSAWLQEIKEARNLLNKVLQEHGMKAGITQADARTYASLRRKDPVAAQQFTQTVVTNASKEHDESKWSE